MSDKRIVDCKMSDKKIKRISNWMDSREEKFLELTKNYRAYNETKESRSRFLKQLRHFIDRYEYVSNKRINNTNELVTHLDDSLDRMVDTYNIIKNYYSILD